jgi:hypothetical protein
MKIEYWKMNLSTSMENQYLSSYFISQGVMQRKYIPQYSTPSVPPFWYAAALISMEL